MNLMKRISLLSLSLIVLSTSAPVLANDDEDETEIVEVHDERLSDGEKVWHGVKGVFWGYISLQLTLPAALCFTLGALGCGAYALASREEEAAGIALLCTLAAVPSDIAAWYTTKWCIEAFQKTLRTERERRFKLRKQKAYTDTDQAEEELE